MDEINKKREEWQQDVDQNRDAAVKDGGTFEEPEMPEDIKDDIKTQPYTCAEKKYIVCLDTLGQDRELTDDQKRFALKSVKKFK